MYVELQQLALLLAAQTPQENGGGCGGGQEQLLLPFIMFAIIYVVWLGPASREQKKQADMVEKLKRGDRIITKSGLIGTIADKSGQVLVVEVARNVKVEMLKSSVAGKYQPEPEKKPDTKSEKKG
ncbi:MAG: preprotein translocase subunit YajC [Myxococcales bacterium]|nr:preprotein translocase subunit YajC [Myxococcales bacterium]